MKPRLKGKAFVVRHVDDAVSCFQNRDAAQRVLEVLGKQCSKYGLSSQPQKTRLVEFRHAAADEGGKAGHSASHVRVPRPHARLCADDSGHSWLKMRTTKKRLKRGLKAVAHWCRMHRHDPNKEQLAALNAKLRGLYMYYAVHRTTRASAVSSIVGSEAPGGSGSTAERGASPYLGKISAPAATPSGWHCRALFILGLA
jgi:hypothetical protein